MKKFVVVLVSALFLFSTITSLAATPCGRPQAQPVKSCNILRLANTKTRKPTRTTASTKTQTPTRTFTGTATLTSTTTVTPTRTATFTWTPRYSTPMLETFYARYAAIETPLYAVDDNTSQVLVIIPLNGRVLFLSYVSGEALVHVRYTPPFNGQDIVQPIDGWVLGSDLSDQKVGTPTFTPMPQCGDC